MCVIRPGTEFVVCVVADGQVCSESQVVMEINRLFPEEERLHREVWARLYNEIPISGLPAANGQKVLRNGVRQFNFGRLPGVGFRILWFYGESPKEIICSSAFVKNRSQSTPDAAIDRARWHRRAFLRALKKGRVRRRNMRPSEL